MPVASFPRPSPAPTRYFEHLAEARGSASRALGRAERALQVATADPSGLEPERISGAISQANQALEMLAAAERYRLRNADLVPRPARDFALRAAYDTEVGVRALRRAEVIVADPQLSFDPDVAEVTLDSLGTGVTAFGEAVEALKAASTYAPQSTGLASP